MSRDSFTYSHGDTGTKPTVSLNFEKNERPNAGNFDWFWTTVIQSVNGHADEFNRLDSDNDGTVDSADGAATWSLNGNTQVTHPTDINFTGDLSLTDDGDGTVTVSVTTYTDSNAQTAVDGANIDITGDADTVDGEHASAFADSGHLHDSRYVLESGDIMGGKLTIERGQNSAHLTATNTGSGDKISLKSNSNGDFTFVGYDSSDGSWDTGSALEYSPDSGVWNFKSLPEVSGNSLATESWVNANADVPDADYADSAGDADTVDGRDIHTGTSSPSNPTSGDIWVDTS